MPKTSSRDWIISTLKDRDGVRLEPVADDFILIHRKRNADSDEKYPSFTTAVISTKCVTENSLDYLFDQEHDFKFITNIPKNAI